MNKELEEAIERLSEDKNKPLACRDITIVNVEDLDIVLDYVENSISKDKIEEYLKQEQKAFDTYKKGSKENENLKNGMWKHLGAKNMCERILEIEKLVTLD